MEEQRSVQDWTVEEVVLFFVQQRLQDYLSVVRANAIDGAKLASLDERQLVDLVRQPGNRNLMQNGA